MSRADGRSPTLFEDQIPTSAATRLRLEGAVEKVLYADPERDFAILRLQVRGRGTQVAIGPLVGIQPGETVRLVGREESDPRHGRRFRARRVEAVQPTTLLGIERYLASGLIEGIGPEIARRMVRRFGLDTLEVIESQPERLQEIEGIGTVRSRRIREAWERHRAGRETRLLLAEHGIAGALATRIERHFGDRAPDIVQRSPHRLAREVSGIGFATADAIARAQGLAADAPERLQAGLLHALRSAKDRGHCFLPAAELVRLGADLLDLPVGHLEGVIDDLVAAGEVSAVRRPERVERAIYLPALERLETRMAARLRHLAGQNELPSTLDVGRAVQWFEERSQLTLAPGQRRALQTLLDAPLAVLTGGPGTGKTTLVRGLVEILAAKKLRVELAAPTGRAAQRLADATGRPAKTLHRLLEFDGRSRRFGRDAEQPVPCDVLVVDESSMVDLALAAAVVDALPERARLVWVGDVDQLPSIGPGRVLADLLASGLLAEARLTDVFRQARRSLIVRNAHRLTHGEAPISGREPTGPRSERGDDDFFFIERQQPQALFDTLVELVVERIPAHFGFDPRTEVQVLSPMRKGALGADRLNAELQLRLNPEGREVVADGVPLRVGDRVMQTRNNYDLGTFNGDIGRVAGFEPSERRASIDFDGRLILYPFARLDELRLAYASTVHKAQGSEYPAVVIPLHTQHFALLERPLLYTALTRAKRLAVLIGSRRAVELAIGRVDAARRHTLLAERLRGEL